MMSSHYISAKYARFCDLKVFNWLYKRIAKGIFPVIIEEFNDWMAEDQTQKDIIVMVDGLVDRQWKRFASKFGGTMKGVNNQIKQRSPLGISPKLNIDVKSLIGGFIQGALAKTFNKFSGNEEAKEPRSESSW